MRSWRRSNSRYPRGMISHLLRLILAIFPVGLLIYLILFSDLLTVNKIECRQDSGDCSADVLAELDKYRGQKIIFLKLSQIEDKISRADNFISQARITIKLPRTIVANLNLRSASAQIGVSPEISEVLLLDKQNMVIGKSNVLAELPVVYSVDAGNLSIGSVVDTRVFKALVIASNLKSISELGNAIIRGNSLEVRRAIGGKIIFSLDKEPETQIRALQLLLNQARIGELEMKSIDLRFDRPVIL